MDISGTSFGVCIPHESILPHYVNVTYSTSKQAHKNIQNTTHYAQYSVGRYMAFLPLSYTKIPCGYLT